MPSSLESWKGSTSTQYTTACLNQCSAMCAPFLASAREDVRRMHDRVRRPQPGLEALALRLVVEEAVGAVITLDRSEEIVGSRPDLLVGLLALHPCAREVAVDQSRGDEVAD